jgi:hypothetical protein
MSIQSSFSEDALRRAFASLLRTGRSFNRIERYALQQFEIDVAGFLKPVTRAGFEGIRKV